MAHELTFDKNKLVWTNSPPITNVPNVGTIYSQAEVNAIVSALNELLQLLRDTNEISTTA